MLSKCGKCSNTGKGGKSRNVGKCSRVPFRTQHSALSTGFYLVTTFTTVPAQVDFFFNPCSIKGPMLTLARVRVSMNAAMTASL